MSAYCNSAIKTANQVCNDYISISVWTGLLDPLVLPLKNIEVYIYDADLQYYTKWTIRIIHRSQFQWQLIIIDGPNLRIRITAEHHMYCKWFFICSIVSVSGGNIMDDCQESCTPTHGSCVSNMRVNTPRVLNTRVRVPIGQKLHCSGNTTRKGGSTWHANLTRSEWHRLVSFWTLCVRLACHVDPPFLLVELSGIMWWHPNHYIR